MINLINQCNNCEGNKKICPFSINKWKGKRDKITGFFIAHVVENENGCTVYSGFAN